jgi:hypothetical protein
MYELRLGDAESSVVRQHIFLPSLHIIRRSFSVGASSSKEARSPCTHTIQVAQVTKSKREQKQKKRKKKTEVEGEGRKRA